MSTEYESRSIVKAELISTHPTGIGDRVLGALAHQFEMFLGIGDCIAEAGRHENFRSSFFEAKSMFTNHISQVLGQISTNAKIESGKQHGDRISGCQADEVLSANKGPNETHNGLQEFLATVVAKTKFQLQAIIESCQQNAVRIRTGGRKGQQMIEICD